MPDSRHFRLFRSRQKLAAYDLGRVLPHGIKHKMFPLFAEDVGVYFNINSDPHLGDTSSECIFSWTVLVRFHASNTERIITHSPKSRALPRETLIEFVYAFFEQISDNNAAIMSDAEEDQNALPQLVKLQCYVFDPGEVSLESNPIVAPPLPFLAMARLVTGTRLTLFPVSSSFSFAAGSVKVLHLEDCTSSSS